jgi:hypothetical protein
MPYLGVRQSFSITTVYKTVLQIFKKECYFVACTRAVIPKVCSADHKGSANPYTNQYFELRGALKCLKGSAHQKSLGTTVLECHMLLESPIDSLHFS